MKSTCCALLICAILITSCRQAVGEGSQQTQTIPVEDIAAVRVVLDAGMLRAAGASGAALQLSSSIDCPVKIEGQTLVVDCQQSGRSDLITLALPADLSLEIDSYAAQVHLEGGISSLQIKNTAGDNTLENFQGEGSIWAGRGDITVSAGEGSLELFSEHGSLVVSGFSGPISLATIMGQIHFQALTDSPHPVSLEADHGAISALIPNLSSYQIKANTAGGEVVCLGGDLERIDRGCRGSTGTGTQLFQIRTVSGRIEVRILP